MKATFLAIFFGLVISISAYGQSSIPKDVGLLLGLVLDESDARVARVKIIIEGKNSKQEIKSNDEGYYEIRLPEGKYEIRVLEENGWYGSARKKVLIVPNKSFTHNFVLKGIRQDSDHP